MDPLSIATGATTLAAFAFKAGRGIYNCIDSIKTADSTLLQLKSEVDALVSALNSLASTFKSKDVVALCESTGVNRPESTKLLVSVKPLLGDCTKTFQILNAMLKNIRGKSEQTSFLQRSKRALQIDLKSKDVDAIRHQIRSYSSAMQVTMQMVAICLSVEGNKQSGNTSAKLEQQLTNLAAQISDVQAKIAEINVVSSPREQTLIVDQDYLQRRQHMDDHVSAAKAVFSDASIYNGSNTGTVIGGAADVSDLAGTFGSVLGLNDDQANRIRQWIPREHSIEDDEEDVDDDDVVFEARLAVAQKRLLEKEYEVAERQFRACLGHTSITERLPLHTLVDLKLDLASACGGSSNGVGHQEVLLELLELDLPTAQQLHLQHMLAAAYLNDEKLAPARKLAETAMQGRRKLLGRQHESFQESIQLLIKICIAQKDLDDADVYRHLLPKNAKVKSKDGSIVTDNSPTLQHKTQTDPPSTKTFINAAMVGDEVQVRRQLDQGVEVNAVDEKERSALYTAVLIGHINIVSLLLDRGASVNTKDTDGFTPLTSAALQGHAEMVKLLLDQGANINATKGDGYTPLMLAAFKGHAEIVKLLLDQGANINITNGDGYTPLMVAVLDGHAEIVKLLLDQGANVNTTNGEGHTPLLVAAIRDHAEIVKLLLDRGADVFATHNDRDTAKDCAMIGTESRRILEEYLA